MGPAQFDLKIWSASSVRSMSLCMIRQALAPVDISEETISPSFQSGRPNPASCPSSRRFTEMPTHTGSPVATAASVAHSEWSPSRIISMMMRSQPASARPFALASNIGIRSFDLMSGAGPSSLPLLIGRITENDPATAVRSVPASATA